MFKFSDLVSLAFYSFLEKEDIEYNNHSVKNIIEQLIRVNF